VIDSGELASLVAAAPDGVVAADGSGLIVYANTTIEQLFGYGPGELVGRRIEELVPERARLVHVGHRQGYVSNPKARPMGGDLELTGRRRDGSEFPVDVSLSPTSVRDGLLVAAFVRDITARKQAEEALRASEERFRLLVEDVVDHALYLVDPQGRVASWNKGAERLKGYTEEEIVGEHLSRFYTRADQSNGVVEHALEVTAREGRYSSEGWRVRKDGSRFRARVSLTRLDDAEGNLRGFAKVTRDITDAYRLAAIADLVQTVLAGASTTSVLETTSRYACAIVDARLAWVVGPIDGGRHLAVLAASGEGADHLTGSIVSDSSVAAAVMAQKESISLPTLQDEDLDLDVAAIGGVGPTLFVPLCHGDRVLGVLVVAHAAGDHPFRDDEIQLVSLFADQAALALHTGQLRSELERLGLLEDRERIARDLHDTVIQRLFATGMSLQASIPLAASSDLRERIDRSITDLDDTIRSIRTTIFDLQRSTPSTQASGARSQILQLASESSRSLGFEPTVHFVGAVDAALDDHVLLELIPTLREALSNVARHAHAGRVAVSLVVDDEITLTVTDDGVGIPESRIPGSKGIANITERAEKLGGRANFGRPEGGGTQLVWSVPEQRPDPGSAPPRTEKPRGNIAGPMD
jgi:PAS domain S-box-containing protein